MRPKFADDGRIPGDIIWDNILMRRSVRCKYTHYLNIIQHFPGIYTRYVGYERTH